MRLPTKGPAYKLALVGAMGCVISLLVGATAATHYGVLIGAAIIGSAFFCIATATYLRDPVLALIGLWVFEVINAPLSAVFGYFSTTGQAIRQGDEILVLLFLALTLRRTLRTNTRLPPLRFVLPGIGVAVFGVLSAVVHGVPWSITLVGAWLGLKLWVMVLISLLLPWKPSDLPRIYRTLVSVGVLVAMLGLADYFSHGAVSRALHTANYNVREGGYRSEAVHSIFPSPGEYSLFMSLLFALAFARFTHRYRKSDLVLALLFAGSVMLSLRLKGFLSLAAVVAIVGLAQGAAGNRRAVAGLLVGALLIAGAYALEGSVITKQVSTYASTETSARSRLYSTGEKIASENFPLGVGFGRFASYPSRLHYSPVYYQYRLNMVYGLSPTYSSFIDDTSWPSVIGEAGYGGFVLYALGIVALALTALRRLLRGRPETRWVPLAALCMLAVLLVDSLGDPSLFAWLSTTTLVMIFGPMLIAVRPPPRRTAT